ncbi:MAG TPA: hydroxyacylglutathione hydrolase [Rhodospirillales bacterium]|nr:hydroxyacylglutathione hydrolase [Rhodospirillales bacterium]
MSALEVLQIAVYDDNYIYLIHDSDSGETACVDPAVAGPVKQALSEKGWTLGQILNTHHHPDHTGGNLELKEAYGCTITGAKSDAARIPGIDVRVSEGDTVSLGDHLARVFDVPGHTSGHNAYWFEADDALFCGDTLFSLGCGRVFEGTADQMWDSLQKLRNLPDDTLVYCAHEYTAANAAFALSVDPDNPALIERANEITELRRADKPTVPSRLGSEKAANPFMRADIDSLKAAAGLIGQDAVQTFAEIRRRKDNF